MKQHNFKTIFQIGDIVFIKLPDSDPYLITNIIVNIGLKTMTYELMGAEGQNLYCKSGEISKDKSVW